MRALIAAATAALTLGGASYIIDQLQPALEQEGAAYTISNIVTEARGLALLDNKNDLAPYLEQAADDILENRDSVTITGATITVRTSSSCWQATVPTVKTPIAISACA